jgi:7-cyano-7-deazaguanine tRNA-ribosyltransferase
MPIHERRIFLAEHNLWTCQTELRRIKQATRNGRLWEHLEMRAHSHPALFQAVKRLDRYKKHLEKHSPSTKRKGLFFFSSVGLARPEIVRHREKMKLRYSPPEKAKILVLLPKTQMKPSRDKKRRDPTKFIGENLDQQKNNIHFCFYAAPFGVIPMELSETYPLSQHETAFPLDEETKRYVAEQLADYIFGTNYEAVALLYDPKRWNKNLLNASTKACKKRRIVFEFAELEEHEKNIHQILKRILQNLRDRSIDSS